MTTQKLRYFKPREFDLTPYGGEIWWPLMDKQLLQLLDKLRDRWGRPIRISPHRGALGRRKGANSLSDHNIDVHSRVMCADVFVEGVDTRHDATALIDAAEAVGLNAIGLYPHWLNGSGEQQTGFHLGRRPGLTRVARWGKIRTERGGPQKQVGQSEALAYVGVPL